MSRFFRNSDALLESPRPWPTLSVSLANDRFHSVKWLFRIAMLIALSMMLAGCPSLSTRVDAPPSVDRATALERSGDYAGAARIYESLADMNAGTARASLLLRAARAYIVARLPDDAARVVAALDANLAPEQAFERRMLGVEIALVRGQAADAWRQITSIAEPTTTPAALRYLGVRLRAAFAAGRPIDGVRAHISRERFLTQPEERRSARRELLAFLRDASERGIPIDPRIATDPLARGWLELGPLAAAAAVNPIGTAPQLESWRSRYPNHPADDVVRVELLGQRDVETQAVEHVALLLPLSGSQAAAASTVRDGFMTAYFVGPTLNRPRIRIYDTGNISISEAVMRATQEGAQFIVGPLTRPEVAAAADLVGPRPPILALNFLPAERVAPPDFYQFALSPEDEARQAARRILADGHRLGIALVPEGDWGTRVLTAFRQELEAGGGTLLDSAAFNASETDYAGPITQVLRIADSRARHRRLESILGTRLSFEPRRRGDIEFIFAASQAATARLLRPQLKFHYAGSIPTYATSDAYEADPNANEDMDGLIFPDMPWTLGSALAESVREAARQAWPSGGPRRNRLFAFGFDAYRLLTALRNSPSGRNVTVEGLTGRLTLREDRQVERQLQWAQLQGGQPRLLPQAMN